MQVDLVELGDAVDFLDNKRVPVREELRKPGPYPYYGANGQQGRIDGYIFDEPLVLLAEDGGHFGSKEKPIAYYVEGKCWVNNHAHVMRTKQGCDAHYLHHILSYYDVSPYITGSTRPKLTKGNAESIKIPLRPLPDQKRIAAFLEKADRLRRTRRYARQLSDTFLQSVFLEMFGESDWERRALGELAINKRGSFVNGPFGSNLLTSELVANGVPVIYIRDIREARYQRISTVCVTPAKAEELKVCQVEGGDVLVAKVGDPPGTAAIYTRGQPVGVITQDVIRIKLNLDLVTPEYLVTFLNSKVGFNTLKPITVEGTRSRFGLIPFKELPIPTPPLPLQQKFADIVRRFERLRAQQREAERQAEHLFQTLLHRAFSPEQKFS